MLNFEITKLQTPCYVVDERLVRENLERLRGVMDAAGCKILLAQKAFSGYWLYPLIGQYLSGTTASGLFEARLGYEEMGKPMGRETHVFSAAYTDSEFDEIVKFCDYIVFNSLAQWEKFRTIGCTNHSKPKYGLRINPECSTQGDAFGGTASYDPCSPGSRLGVRAAELEVYVRESGLPPRPFGAPLHRGELAAKITGLHFHTLCEQNSDDLVKTVEAVEEKFGKWLGQMEWVNFGGGHHITREDYDTDLLIKCIKNFKRKYGVDVYLEPGEAVVLNAGYMVATVLDVVKNDGEILILDASAACHAPDIIEAPYRAPVVGAVVSGETIPEAGLPGEKPYTYRLAGPTCLAGDVFGEYSFDKPIGVGDKIVFGDMAHYSMVKNNTFNGMPLPTIYSADEGGVLKVVKSFGYEDFKGRV